VELPSGLSERQIAEFVANDKVHSRKLISNPTLPSKTNRASYQSPEQKAFQERAEAAGAIYAVVRSIEDVQKLGL
jgi:hypothetical protein